MLKISLLGTVQITLHDQPVDRFVTAKARALFCYLAATGQVHTRLSLAGLFWGDAPEDNARRSLRVALSNLHQ